MYICTYVRSGYYAYFVLSINKVVVIVAKGRSPLPTILLPTNAR
jgi:hypothetical protein